MITKEQVDKIAKLAKLDVEGEEEKLAKMFTETLEKMEILNEIDTSNVEETFQVTGLKNVFQKDEENKRTLTKEGALSNGKEIINGLFATKGVFARE